LMFFESLMALPKAPTTRYTTGEVLGLM